MDRCLPGDLVVARASFSGTRFPGNSSDDNELVSRTEADRTYLIVATMRHSAMSEASLIQEDEALILTEDGLGWFYSSAFAPVESSMNTPHVVTAGPGGCMPTAADGKVVA